MFAVGGIITIISIFLQPPVPFYLGYMFGLIILIMILAIYYFYKIPPKEDLDIGWIMIKLKNGDRYKGKYHSSNSFGLTISSTKNEPISKIGHLNKIEDQKAKKIIFNREEILNIYTY